MSLRGAQRRSNLCVGTMGKVGGDCFASARNDMGKWEMDKQYYVYIMTNVGNTTLYTGVTSDLRKRVYEHKEKLVEGFTKRYSITKLVYYEICSDIESAILREKQIKAGSREKKIKLVNSVNSEWRNLYDEL